MNKLNAKQLQKAQSRIYQLPPGRYEASEIYGADWEAVDSPYREGRLFRITVVQGYLKDIKAVGRNYSNHMVYEITH